MTVLNPEIDRENLHVFVLDVWCQLTILLFLILRFTSSFQTMVVKFHGNNLSVFGYRFWSPRAMVKGHSICIFNRWASENNLREATPVSVSVFKASDIGSLTLLLSTHLFDFFFFLPPSPSFNDPTDYVGPTWIIQNGLF